jgi:hypothetical protein
MAVGGRIINPNLTGYFFYVNFIVLFRQVWSFFLFTVKKTP